MAVRDDREDAIGDDLMSQLTVDARLLEVRDEAEDIALDLHEAPFSTDTRTRALTFLDSPRYRDAAASFRTGLPDGAVS